MLAAHIQAQPFEPFAWIMMENQIYSYSAPAIVYRLSREAKQPIGILGTTEFDSGTGEGETASQYAQRKGLSSYQPGMKTPNMLAGIMQCAKAAYMRQKGEHQNFRNQSSKLDTIGDIVAEFIAADDWRLSWSPAASANPTELRGERRIESKPMPSGHLNIGKSDTTP